MSEDRIARIKELRAVAKNSRIKQIKALTDAEQYAQDLFQAIENLQMTLAERLDRSSHVVVVYIGDMVHYNISKPSQLNPDKGLVNMFSAADREALRQKRAKDPDWWIDDRRLVPVVATDPKKFEVRTVNVERCLVGESLPDAGGINWNLIGRDVQEFWTQTFKSLGAKEVRWNYK